MLPEEVSHFIGKPEDARTFEVEKGAIQRFADAVDDHNPLYWDEEYARNSRFDSIIAPPGFWGWPTERIKGALAFSGIRQELIHTLVEAGYSILLDGGIDYEFLKPVRAGDTLTASSKIKDIIERGGQMGKTAFVITETTYTNQNGDLVAKIREINSLLSQ